MSQLRSMLVEATGFDPGALSAEELVGEITEVLWVVQQLEVAVAGWMRNLTDRDGPRALGYSSSSALLADRGRLSPAHARRIVSDSNAVRRAPLAYQGWADGRLSTDQARHLFAAAEALPDSYREAEEQLVEIVEPLDPVDTRKSVEYWRQAVDGPGDLSIESQTCRRGLSVSRLHGMCHVEGWLTDHAGEAFGAVIDAYSPPPRDGEQRTPSQRRHDALENACRDLLDNGTTPTVGGEKPHISLICDLPALQGIAGGVHESVDGEIIDVNTLRMVACDASITRIVFGPESEILDVGRKTRVWSAGQRRAIIARDQHCQGPGCRARPAHCDIHHIAHWADGGQTAVDNGVLLCRSCHTLTHHDDSHRHKRRTRG